MLGSASYMSPEQVGGSESVDGRADIFSTGVVLYELLTGKKPFEGDSPTAVIVKILKDDPNPIDAAATGLPAERDRGGDEGAAKRSGEPLPDRRRDEPRAAEHSQASASVGVEAEHGRDAFRQHAGDAGAARRLRESAKRRETWRHDAR